MALQFRVKEVIFPEGKKAFYPQIFANGYIRKGFFKKRVQIEAWITLWKHQDGHISWPLLEEMESVSPKYLRHPYVFYNKDEAVDFIKNVADPEISKKLSGIKNLHWEKVGAAFEKDIKIHPIQ